MYKEPQAATIIGNDFKEDKTLGFREEIKQCLESYNIQGIDAMMNFDQLMTSPTKREDLIQATMETLTTSPVFTNPECKSSPFYNNYVNRVDQLERNTIQQIARESVMWGYAPIVSYAPFFLKNQWVNCVMKDVIMTEIPDKPLINIAYEKRYIKLQDGTRYELPFCNFDDEAMAKINAEATGQNIDSSVQHTLPLTGLNLLQNDYIEGDFVKTPSTELTMDMYISEAEISVTGTSKTYKGVVPTTIRVDSSTHNFLNVPVSFAVYESDDDTKAVKAVVDYRFSGSVDFQRGTVQLFGAPIEVVDQTGDPTGITTASSFTVKVRFTGKVSNRWNERSISVERESKRESFVMPESGPRINTPITIEDAADALALQDIDQIADNIDMMGLTLANMEDFEIRKFLKDSYLRQMGLNIGPHGYEKLVAEATFDALPPAEYNGNVTAWMDDSREYFERLVAELKIKLRSENCTIVAVCHPNLIRFLNGKINWSMADGTEVSGMKLQYSFGIYTTGSDRVHFVTSMYLNPDDGISLVVIPQTQELITFKHYKMSTTIDRGYRNPQYTLVPNIMATQRTLTFEILPVQGKFNVKNRGLESPTTYKRVSE